MIIYSEYSACAALGSLETSECRTMGTSRAMHSVSVNIISTSCSCTSAFPSHHIFFIFISQSGPCRHMHRVSTPANVFHSLSARLISTFGLFCHMMKDSDWLLFPLQLWVNSELQRFLFSDKMAGDFVSRSDF